MCSVTNTLVAHSDTRTALSELYFRGVEIHMAKQIAFLK